MALADAYLAASGCALLCLVHVTGPGVVCGLRLVGAPPRAGVCLFRAGCSVVLDSLSALPLG
jgi:hypothetical protein